MSVEKALKIDGWMDIHELEWLAEHASKSYNVIEVGSWKGRSSMALSTCKGVLYCIDHWKGSPNSKAYDKELLRLGSDGIREKFIENMFQELSDKKVSVWCGDSVEMLGILIKLGVKADMVFIDGDHTYPCVKMDILYGKKMLNPGGLLSGHDYSCVDPGVVEAVDELIPNRKVYKTIWFATKEE